MVLRKSSSSKRSISNTYRMALNMAGVGSSSGVCSGSSTGAETGDAARTGARRRQLSPAARGCFQPGAVSNQGFPARGCFQLVTILKVAVSIQGIVSADRLITSLGR